MATDQVSETFDAERFAGCVRLTLQLVVGPLILALRLQYIGGDGTLGFLVGILLFLGAYFPFEIATRILEGLAKRKLPAIQLLAGISEVTLVLMGLWDGEQLKSLP